MKYRRKTPTVEAVQLTINAESIEAVETLCGGDAEVRNGVLIVATRRGALRVNVNDWVIKYLDNGDVMAIDPITFAAMYEPFNEHLPQLIGDARFACGAALYWFEDYKERHLEPAVAVELRRVFVALGGAQL